MRHYLCDLRRAHESDIDDEAHESDIDDEAEADTHMARNNVS